MKAVLEIDMPDSCNSCVLHKETEYWGNGKSVSYCYPLRWRDDDTCPNNGKRTDCPLKPIATP